jgi:uncharacterized protein (TIGR02001 family)
MAKAASIFIACLALGVACVAAPAGAAGAREAEHWVAPLGGTFTANLTLVSDYSFGGISQTQRQPAVQPGLGYTTAKVSETVPLSAYLWVWGSNVNFASSGPGVEVDLMGGLKLKAHDDRLGIDLGYLRYFYPGSPAALSYNYGDFTLTGSYDLDVVLINAKVRYSPNSFGNSGNAWDKRVRLTAPLPFLSLNQNISFKAYGTLGNQWVERYLNYGIPSNDYWYWQAGVITSAWGIDIGVAYTGTTIDVAGCGNTTNCQGRVIMTVGKTF